MTSKIIIIIEMLVLLVVLFTGLVAFSSSSVHRNIQNDVILKVKDKPLLTPEQQRILVREGSVEAHGIIFENNKDIIPYLDEGGIR